MELSSKPHPLPTSQPILPRLSTALVPTRQGFPHCHPVCRICWMGFSCVLLWYVWNCICLHSSVMCAIHKITLGTCRRFRLAAVAIHGLESESILYGRKRGGGLTLVISYGADTQGAFELYARTNVKAQATFTPFPFGRHELSIPFIEWKEGVVDGIRRWWNWEVKCI